MNRTEPNEPEPTDSPAARSMAVTGRPVRDLDELLAGASIAADVWALRPDYRAFLVAVDGIDPAAECDDEHILREAERSTAAVLVAGAVEQLPHVAAWRDAYRAFGAKPQRTRNSLEALMRRSDDGLPRLNHLTNIYNAVSVEHQIPIGGEDLDHYVGFPRLARADGTEAFTTVVGGEEVVEHPEVGEVVWRDDIGVTCRRWNWRQTRRTQLSSGTTTALFILDVLDPVTDTAANRAVDDLVERVAALGSNVSTFRRSVAGPAV